MTTTDSYLRDVELDMEANLGRGPRELLDSKFKCTTRLTAESFELLSSILEERWQDNDDEPPMVTYSGRSVSLATCVYLTLRFLSAEVSGQRWDFMNLVGVPSNTFERIVWATINAIVSSTHPLLDTIKFPQTSQELVEAAAGFKAISKGRTLPSCVSVIDGHLLRMFRVRTDDDDGDDDDDDGSYNMIDVGGEEMRFDMMLYYSGHYEHRDGLNLQVAVDSKGRFQFVGAAAAAAGPSSGVLSDNDAIRESGLLDMINRLPAPYVAMADANYSATDALAALYTNEDVAKHPTHRQFNDDCARPLVDRVRWAVGGMAKMWNILQKPLKDMTDDQAMKLVVATARLYHFNMDQGVKSTKATLLKASEEFFVATTIPSSSSDAGTSSRREQIVMQMASKKAGLSRRPSKKARVALGDANGRA